MFGSGSDIRYESGGLSRPLLIPTRFIWPYGGRQVLISGSFTRWLKLIPMTPVEGHQSVFQVIWNLSPGYHQYKFFIDGEWMYDQHQPFVCENYGVVNTIFLAPREGDLVPTIYSPEPVRSNMDIDNDVVMPAVPIPRISQADLELSRHRLSVFMSKSTAYELLPESGKVVALDTNLPVKEAFSILYEQGIPTAPIFDTSKSQFVGVLSALDFILILREVGKLENRGTSMTEEQLGNLTIKAWKEWKLHLTKVDGSGRSHPSSLIHAGPNDSLKEVVLKILQNNVATVPIILSSSADCCFPQLLHPASLSGILKCMCRQFRNSSTSLPVLQQPICAIPLGTWVPNTGDSNGRSLALLKTNASLGDALSLLLQAEVSSLPIVNENDSLVDIFSRRDISAMARHRAYKLIHLNEISIYQAIRLGRPTNSPYGIFTGQRCHMCLRSDPLQKVMEQLAIPGVRRLVIVEAGTKRVQGIISLSDVFKFLLT